MGRRDIRRIVLESALAVFAEKGFANSTIADIRANAEVSNGAVFHHFHSKEAIAEAIYVEGIASYQAGITALLDGPPTSPYAAVGAAILHQLEWTERNPDLARFIYERGRPKWNVAAAEQVRSLNQDLAARIYAWLAPHVLAGRTHEVSVTVLAACVVGPAHFVAKRWLEGSLKIPPTAFAEELTESAWAALAPGGRLAASSDRPGPSVDAISARVLSFEAGAGHAKLVCGAPVTSATSILEKVSLLAANSTLSASTSSTCRIVQFSSTIHAAGPARTPVTAEAEIVRTVGHSVLCAFVDAVLKDEGGNVWARSSASCLADLSDG